MLISEFILILVVASYLFFRGVINKKFNRTIVPGLLFLLLAIHLIFDGPRWQMIPGYILWLIAFIQGFVQTNRRSSIFFRIIVIVGIFILLPLSIALPSILPVFELPEISGPYIVGTKDLLLELEREEVITDDKNDQRSLMIKVWYPSKEKGKQMDPYVDRGGRNGFAQKYGLMPYMLNYLDKVETNVYKDVEIANETFPVLIFSHGYNSKANGYYALLSELTSHGYVVFSINHTYESTGSTFPDGTIKYFDYQYADQIQSDTWKIMEPVVEAFERDLTFEERHPIVKKGLKTYFVRDMVERWALDIMDVVNKLNDWNQEGPFKGKLDISRVGAFGHSRGGGPAGEALLIDDRIKAAANIDGVQWGQIVDTAFKKPFLFLSADWPVDNEDLNQHAYVNKSTSVFYEGMILQSAHSNFMDIPYMIPLKSLSQAGDIDPYLAGEITENLLISFFDKHLKNHKINMNSLKSEYDMLELNIYVGDSLNKD